MAEILKIQRKTLFNQSIFSRTTGPNSTKFGTWHPWVMDKWKTTHFFKGDKRDLVKLHYQHLQNNWANFSQTWHKLFLGDENFVSSNKGPHPFTRRNASENQLPVCYSLLGPVLLAERLIDWIVFYSGNSEKHYPIN